MPSPFSSYNLDCTVESRGRLTLEVFGTAADIVAGVPVLLERSLERKVAHPQGVGVFLGFRSCLSRNSPSSFL